MNNISRCIIATAVYSIGVYVSYIDINKSHIGLQNVTVSNPKSICSHIVLYTRVSYQHAKDYYYKRTNPFIYATAWPLIQLKMGTTSIFTGTLVGFIEWNEHNKGLKNK